MWRKHGWVVFRKPCRFHHIGAHSCSSKGTKPPRNPMVTSVFYFVISLETPWFIFHGPQVLWNKDWVAFIPKVCQNQDVEEVWMVTGKGHWLVLDSHTNGGHVNKSFSFWLRPCSDFRAPKVLLKHIFKAKADIENESAIAPSFFFFFQQISHICFYCMSSRQSEIPVPGMSELLGS